jgi:hypothetical protein
VTDDETASLVVSTSSLTVAEGDDADYTVKLSTEPTAQVTVAISGHSGTDLSLDKTSLTFTTANWNTAQTVTVTAAEDDDAADDTATLTHTASGGDYGSVTADLPVTVTDDETASLVVSTSSLTVAEGDDADWLHGEAVDRADGAGDGGDQRPLGDGPEPGQDLAHLHDGELEHGADGDGDGGRGRRRGERPGNHQFLRLWPRQP